MLATALPIRVGPDGKLVQQDAFDAILGLLRVMAGTTATTFPHAPWFGLHEAFAEAARREKQDHESLKDALNTALRELGVEEYTVQSVTSGPPRGGERGFQITMIDAAGRAQFGRLGAEA